MSCNDWQRSAVVDAGAMISVVQGLVLEFLATLRLTPHTLNRAIQASVICYTHQENSSTLQSCFQSVGCILSLKDCKYIFIGITQKSKKSNKEYNPLYFAI